MIEYKGHKQDNHKDPINKTYFSIEEKITKISGKNYNKIFIFNFFV